MLEPREVCMRCRRPASVCYCAHLPQLETRTKVVILQHPREREMPIGTAHMASLCLTNSEMHVGVQWENSRVMERVLSDAKRPAALLYPGEHAVDVLSAPPPGPVTLVVIDGTWSQAKKVVRSNPVLAQLPRYAFAPPAPSEYRIRREPKDDYVSTIEALVHVLGALEGEPARFEAMLTPFRAMVDAQLACRDSRKNDRAEGAPPRHAVKPPASRARVLPGVLRDRARRADLVCVLGEANAWPYRGPKATRHPVPDLAPLYPDELVHWVAERVATGERFEALVAPRNPLAPNTCDYTDLTAEELAAGESLESALTRWQAFLREKDVLCTWGHYGASLLARSGGWLPEARVDVRAAARMFTRGRAGAVEDFITRLVPMPAVDMRERRGRAGERVAQLVAVTRRFAHE